MTPEQSGPITIIGAGLAGSLLATLLAQRGFDVEVFEKRGDPRRSGYEGGRSINLALAERGLHALRQAGLAAEIHAQTVMMRGRMVHFLDGHTQLQRYGKDDSEVIWSVHRGRLNLSLLDAAERAGARFHFNLGLDGVDFEQRRMRLKDSRGQEQERDFHVLLGTDGAGSALRHAMSGVTELGERFEPLGHGYKELEIPPTPSGDFRIEPNALHIWPRGGYMCIALPNSERSFTVTLFLPNEANDQGEPHFGELGSDDAVTALFERDFADLLPQVPELLHDFRHNPTGLLATLYLDRWHYRDQAVLLGDAAHAMVPFHGQGMNCAFEDCVALANAIDAESDWGAVFDRFERERHDNAEAIQQMALENYIEMRDRVDDADYLLQRELGRLLAERHPDRFLPRYSMVSFRRIPYAVARERGEQQRALLKRFCDGKQRIEDIDLPAVDTAVLAEISPLPANDD